MKIVYCAVMKTIEEYTTEQLIALYKRQSVYATTWWFKHYRMYKMKPEEQGRPFISGEINIPGQISSPGDIRVFNGYAIKNCEYKIDSLQAKDGDNQREILKLRFEKEALTVVNDCIYWFMMFDEHKTSYMESDEPEKMTDPEEIEAELHINDDYNIEQGVATDYQVYEFVWETLQHLNVTQLSKLIKFAETGVEKKWQAITAPVGRKSRNCELKQIDIETGKVVKTYSTRNELIKETGIKKSHLSQCIKTANDNPDNREGWKKWIGEDGRKYGFVELIKAE